MKITDQLRGAAIGLLVFAVSNVFSVYINSVANDSKVVNYAGIVRGATQRLVKLEMAGKKSDELIARLDKIVAGLVKGDRELELPAATDPEFVAKLGEVQNSWQSLKGTIAQARVSPQSRNELLTQSEDYFDLANEAVSAAEAYSQAKANRLRAIQLILFALNLVILGVIWAIARNIALGLQNSTSSIASSSNQIASAVEEQERTIATQAASIRQMSSTMDELGASSQQSAEQAEASTAGANQALLVAESGTKAAQKTLNEMSVLKDKVADIAEQISHLSDRTHQIGSISDLVAELASETNMLALNASVEAARAGTHGKGFAVVAGEIRRLADQSKQSADKINLLVGDIQSAINSTVTVTDKGTKTVAQGMQLTQETAKSFAGVADAINNIFLNNQQISLNIKQQAIATQQVVEAMNSLTLAAHDTAGGISQVKVGTQQLNDAAQNLKAMV
ncbi:methyl-accepting chemotaxis protein [Aliterella atlantica]|uniref:Chemotaxis protein n=1 Tax=Aliterella atlantica CENA595 TaxID=1618023 RepID=A0A0D8ZS97_9CYAN|nr:methyl-accepting chemotaxis protein [Aliterella atlantica]KJH71369.1 chemotaxis protein [Aliterella atlantica CENA595]